MKGDGLEAVPCGMFGRLQADEAGVEGDLGAIQIRGAGGVLDGLEGPQTGRLGAGHIQHVHGLADPGQDGDVLRPASANPPKTVASACWRLGWN